MKTIKKVLLLLTFIAITLSCSSSDDDSSDSGLKGVPTGEIVAKELRDKALTGFSNLTSSKSVEVKGEKNEETQKWWTHVKSNFSFSGNCDGEEDENYCCQGYFAFYPDGKMYYRTSYDGTPVYYQDWEWTNGNKTHLYVDGETSVPFQLTYLNNSNLVFGSKQSQGGCSLITYEELNEPYFE